MSDELIPRPAVRTSFGEQLRASRKAEIARVRKENNYALKEGKFIPSGEIDKVIEQRKIARAKVKANKETEKEASQKAKQVMEARRQQRSKVSGPVNSGIITPKTGEKVYPMRLPDLTGKVQVQLDNKTWVYVTPGADIAAIKQKFLNRELNAKEDRDRHHRAYMDSK